MMIPEYGCAQSGFYRSLGQAFLYQGFHALSSLFQTTTLPTQKQRHSEISDQVTLLVRKEAELKSVTSDSKIHDLCTRDSIRGKQRPVELRGINGIRQVQRAGVGKLLPSSQICSAS